ncbi:MAG: hypothetical protein WCV90_08750 [Candidatus Woesearchaeota archaeon]|jgi:hypothetical protein
MTDTFLEHPELLQGQPKISMGDYLEANGVLVPRRFSTLKEARASGLPIMARSEHPQDYAGSSDLIYIPKDLLIKHPEIIDEEELKQGIAAERWGYSHIWLEHHAEILGLDKKEFMSQFSLSYWELIEGFNRTVTADSALPDRYHITATYDDRETKENLEQYIVVEKKCIREYSQVIRNGNGNGAPLAVINDLDNLIELYERIRNLGQFDSHHCPTMEFQTRIVGSKVENYSLQYHRTRDFEVSTFKLEEMGRFEEGIIPSYYLRGATPPGGKTCKVVVAYAADNPPEGLRRIKAFERGKWKWQVDDLEEGSLNEPMDHVMNEIMSRRRYLHIINSGRTGERFNGIVNRHVSRSLWFKPKVSVFMNYEDIKRMLPREELDKMEEKAKETGENQYINLHVVADGRKAFIKRV